MRKIKVTSTGYDPAQGRSVKDPTLELISLNDAAAQGIERIRKPIWANPMDHFKLDIFEGKPGPWLHLWCPFNRECNGRDPVDICWIIQFGTAAADAPEFIPYTGPLPDTDAYKAEVAKFARFSS